MTRDQELAWAAGFFDGEGSTFTSVRTKGRRMILLMGLCQRPYGGALVEEFHRIVGVGSVAYGKLITQWRVGGYKDVSSTINLLRPYLHEIKLLQAELAFERYLAYDGPRNESILTINKLLKVP